MEAEVAKKVRKSCFSIAALYEISNARQSAIGEALRRDDLPLSRFVFSIKRDTNAHCASATHRLTPQKWQGAVSILLPLVHPHS